MAQQFIGAGLPGDPAQRPVRQPQFLGEQIQSTTGVALALILGSVALNQWAQQRRVQREAALCQAS